MPYGSFVHRHPSIYPLTSSSIQFSILNNNVKWTTLEPQVMWEVMWLQKVTAPSVQIQYCSWYELPLHSCTWPGQLWRDRQVLGLCCILQAQQLQADYKKIIHVLLYCISNSGSPPLFMVTFYIRCEHFLCPYNLRPNIWPS